MSAAPHGPAVATGAAVGIAVAAPAALIARLVLDDDSALVFAVFVVVLAGFALGGAVAGLRGPDAPLLNGAAAAVAAYVVVQALGAVAQAVRGDELRPLTYLVNVVLAGAMGVLGGLAAERRVDPGPQAGG